MNRPDMVFASPLTFSEELKLAIKERNVLTTKTRMKVLHALNDLTRESEMEKKREMRLKVVDEIYSSEMTYLNQLEIIMKFFMEPIRQRNWLPQMTFNALFGNIETIYRVNGELMKELKEGESNVANAFNKMAPYLKLYSVYAFDYKKALNILQNMVKDNKALNQFIKQQETRPEVGTSIQSLLIVPIQRIPRYRLLLQELLRHTPREDRNYILIQDALTKMEQIAEHINELIAEYENAERMLHLARRLTRSPVDIIIPGRKILNEGCLMKVTRTGRRSHPRYVVLFNDSLMYCKGGDEGTLIFSCLMPLKHCKFEAVLGSEVFKVTCQKESVLFYGARSGLMQDWLTALQEAAKEYKECRSTLRRESSKGRPIRRGDRSYLNRPTTLPSSPEGRVSSSCFSALYR